MQPMIDLARHHFVRHIGDLSIYGSWVFNEDQEDTEPCLVVIPRYRTTGFKPVVVALSAAYRYNNPVYLANVAGYFCKTLGYADDMATANKVASLIADHLHDLIIMPENPTSSVVVGEAYVTSGGKKRTIELLDHVLDR